MTSSLVSALYFLPLPWMGGKEVQLLAAESIIDAKGKTLQSLKV